MNSPFGLFLLGGSVLISVAVFGCRDVQRPNPVANAAALNDLENKTGVAFPKGTTVLSHDDGGGREPSHQFYQWLVFAPSQIAIPTSKQPGVKDYLTLPLEDTVKYVESRMPQGKIKDAQIALSSNWETNGFGFGGTIVRTAAGDYLVITQGRLNK